MANKEANRLLAEIGQILADDGEYPIDETLLYARVEQGMVAPSIFEDRSNHILYREPDLDRLSDALLDLWNTEGRDKRWAEIEYIIRNGTFAVTYSYSEAIDSNEDTFDRRDRIVRRYFGDKPIVYPPLNDDDDGLQYEF